jgi:hypothetical protein
MAGRPGLATRFGHGQGPRGRLIVRNILGISQQAFSKDLPTGLFKGPPMETWREEVSAQCAAVQGPKDDLFGVLGPET